MLRRGTINALISKSIPSPSMVMSLRERRDWLPAYFITFEAITTVLVAIAIVSRLQRRSGRLGLDGCFILIAWGLNFATTVFSVFGAIHLGFDGHVSDVPSNRLSNAIQIFWLISLLYVLSTSFTKLSVLLFYRRLTQPLYSTRFKWAIRSAILFIIVYSIVVCNLIIFRCLPVEGLWLSLRPEYRKEHKFVCSNDFAAQITSYISGVLSVLTDMYTVALPWWAFRNLQITKRQRIGLSVILGVGNLVVVAGIVRIVLLTKAEGDSRDRTLSISNVIIASKTESDLGIICACAPSLKSCFRHYFRDGKGDTSYKSQKRDDESQVYGQMLGLPRYPIVTIMDEKNTTVNEREIVSVSYDDDKDFSGNRHDSVAAGMPHNAEADLALRSRRASLPSHDTASTHYLTSPTLVDTESASMQESFPTSKVLSSPNNLSGPREAPTARSSRLAADRAYAVDMLVNPLRAHPPSQEQRSWLALDDARTVSEAERDLMRRIMMYR